MQEKKQKTKKYILMLVLFALVIGAVAVCFAAFAISAEDTNYIYFDLAAGKVTINASTYTGYVYQTIDGVTTTVTVSGTHNEGNRYYVYQSTAANRATTGRVGDTTTITLPQYNRVTFDSKAWGEYITNNTDTDAVANNWKEAAEAVGRTSTANYIAVTGNGKYDITIDNLWSSINDPSTSRTTGGISFIPAKGGVGTFRLVGDTRFGNVHYNYKFTTDDGTRIVFENGDKSGTLGTMTVVSYDGKANHYNSVIGGNDGSNTGYACGMHFNSGIIYAGGRTKKSFSNGQTDNCTAIGGGGNETGVVVIDGATVTAVSTTTGTAIGGGIGYSSTGGIGHVTITNGKVFAYNLGYTVDGYVVPASAIGGAGSNISYGSKGTVIITGGTVYAKSVGGSAIGGGSSVSQQGGDAEILIGGTADVTALSIAGTVNGAAAQPGVSIGGGTSGPKGSSSTHTGGNAKITITGGTLKTGSIGGGECIHGKAQIGNAEVLIKGGTLQAQVIMAGGASKACSFTMTGGTFDNSGKTSEYTFIKEDGGAVYMNDTRGVCNISGGTIRNTTAENGGAVYMTAGTFTMSGGSIENTKANGLNGRNTDNTEPNGLGGAVYLGGGTVNINGGNISGCKANVGGAIYVSGGDVYMRDGILASNQSQTDGGAIYVQNGNVNMSGGRILLNSALGGSGGGVMVLSEQSARVDMTSGEISGNKATVDGGAIAVYGGANGTIDVVIGVHELHFDENDVFVGCDHDKDPEHKNDKKCPILKDNTTNKEGGAIFIRGEENTHTNLYIYCIVESGNRGGGNAAGSEETTQSDFMKVEGGTVAVISSADTVSAGEADNGYNQIGDSMHITGGTLDISGSMVNPIITAPITVDVTLSGGRYNDTRTNNDKGLKYFKLNYYENFKINGVPTGQYTSYAVALDEQYVVRPVMYSNSGYSIRGWNYLQEPEVGNEGKMYPVGSIIDFSEANLDNITGLDQDNAILVLYAIWDFNSYYVNFLPNVPAGQTYTGSMDTYTFSSTATQVLPNNPYKYTGNFFLGWSLDKETVILYDGQSFEPLTKTNGETLTLYAVWRTCSHQTETVNDKVYTIVPETTVSGGTLTQSCSCGHSRYVTLTVHDSTYNGTANQATVSYSSTAWAWEPLTVLYTPTKAQLVDGLAVNADSYDASITVGGETLELSFVINKARQAAPVKPTYTVSGNQLTVGTIANSTESGVAVKYGLCYYTSGGATNTDWGDATVFTLHTDWTTYYVSVYYPETDNYLQSEIVSSDTQFVYQDKDLKAIITIASGEGIVCVASKYEVNDTLVGVKLTVSLLSGYYYPSSFTAQRTAGSATFARLSADDDVLVYTITNIAANDNIHINISDAAKAPTIAIAVGAGEHFGPLEGAQMSATVAEDSAFTIRLTVSDYLAYSGLRITFDKALPAGTTLILKNMTDNTYWYCTLNSGTTEIQLVNFSQMGVHGDFTEGVGDLEYQIIINFARVSEADRLSTLNMSVAADKTDVKAPDFVVHSINVHCETLSFSMTSGDDGEDLKADLSISFAPQLSTLSASNWIYKNPVLVLIPTGAARLGDMTLIATEMISGIPKITSYTVDANGRFIVPIDRNATQVSLALDSRLFPVGESTYTFSVSMYASEVPKAPMDDMRIADSISLTFTADVSDIAPAISVSTDKKLYDPQGRVSISIEAKNVNGYSYELLLMKENEDGEYAATASPEGGTWTQNDASESFTVPLLGLYDKGNYCIVVTLRDENNVVVSEARCYFMIYN